MSAVTPVAPTTAHVAVRRASPHHKTPSMPSVQAASSSPAAALVAINICVTFIASARPLLRGGVLQLLTGLLQVGLLLFGGTLSLGMRVPYSLPSCPFGLALGCLGGVPGLVALAHLNILLSRGAFLGASGWAYSKGGPVLNILGFQPLMYVVSAVFLWYFVHGVV